MAKMSALAATIDRLKVGDNFLPGNVPKEKRTGSLNRLETCLISKLPSEQHEVIKKAIRALRSVHQARSAGSHDAAEGSLIERLAALGITDAPPNWTSAWDTIRAITVDALATIRRELRQWIDTQDA